MLLSPNRMARSAIVIKPSTLLKFHKALVRRKYLRLFSSHGNRKPGQKVLIVIWSKRLLRLNNAILVMVVLVSHSSSLIHLESRSIKISFDVCWWSITIPDLVIEVARRGCPLSLPWKIAYGVSICFVVNRYHLKPTGFWWWWMCGVDRSLDARWIKVLSMDRQYAACLIKLLQRKMHLYV